MAEHAYIHIPFCIRKCNYCSFISGEDIEKKEIYISALIKEIKTRYKNEKLKTLYFGGGTPSLLDIEDIETILSCFSFYNNAEITLEINPETIEYNKSKSMKDIGINRVSLGIQTFDDKLLSIAGRKHSQKNIYSAINDLKLADFDNISIDLIYGLPSQTIEIFKQDIKKALELDIQHISTYGLKIEKNSYFYLNKPKNLPDEDNQAQMYRYLCQEFENNNYAHYEISNFAKEGYESRHNKSYWENKNYYGFGQNASGYENNCRYRNSAVFSKYIKDPLKKEEEFFLSEKEILEEEIFLSLRLKDGININNINKKFHIDFKNKYKKILEKHINTGLLQTTQYGYNLSLNGILLSNEVMSDFID